MPKKSGWTSKIVTRFAARSLVFVILMAIAVGFVVTRSLERIHVQEAARTGQLTANALMADTLRYVPLDIPLAGADKAAMDSLAKSIVREDGVFAIKLWNDQGRLVYSTNAEDEVGRTFPEESDIAEALSGEVDVEVKREPDEETANQFAEQGPLIEVYSPLVLEEGATPIGAFEVYSAYAPVAAEVRRTNMIVWALIIFGAIPAYFVQLRLVKRTADELERSHQEMVALNERLADSLNGTEDHIVHTLQALTAAVDSKDAYTARHSMAVSDYALAIGRRLGADEDTLSVLERAGLLHHVGKIGIAEDVLTKEGRLDPAEMAEVKAHSETGADIIETIPAISGLSDAVRYHHERWDGAGYPEGLSGADIPLAARILAVADAFDAMTTDRPYRKALRPAEARHELVRCRGTQFDPDCVDALLAEIDEGGIRVPAWQDLKSPGDAAPNQA